MRFFYVLILVFSIILSGCEKPNEMRCIEQSMTEHWEKFIGEYKVYDELDNYLHDMSISHFFKGDNVFGNPADSLVAENFAGNFDLKFEFNLYQDSRALRMGTINPLNDLDDHSWYFWSSAPDPYSDYEENKLIGDTLVLYYILDNTPYWLSDGVDFFSCECREIAVKQN